MSWTPVTDGHGGWRRDVADPQALVIVLHGYSRSGDNIRQRLAEPLSRELPDVAFYAPDGFETYEGSDYAGRQWFSRRDITPALRLERLQAIQSKLDGLIQAELDRLGLAHDRLVLAGFSQGAIISLHQAARAPQRFALALAYAGRLATPITAANDTPVQIVHGSADGELHDVEAGAAQFRDAGRAVGLNWLPGLAHDLSDAGIRVGIDAIRRVLP